MHPIYAATKSLSYMSERTQAVREKVRYVACYPHAQAPRQNTNEARIFSGSNQQRRTDVPRGLIRQPNELPLATHPLEIERGAASELRLVRKQKDVGRRARLLPMISPKVSHGTASVADGTVASATK